MTARPAMLLVAHGSRDPRHAAVVDALVRRVRVLRPWLSVAAGFLDFNAPDLSTAATRLAAGGAREVIATPLLLTRAYHATSDIPDRLTEISARLPGLRVRQAEVLGPSQLLVSALERRLADAGVRPADRSRTGVVLAAAGSSDPNTGIEIAAIAQAWRRTGWHAVRPAFATTAPATRDAVRALRAEDVDRVAVARYFIADGRLSDRIAQASGAADVLTPVLGAAPELARLVLLRYARACTSVPVDAI